MKKTIREQLDFTFSIRDFNTITVLLEQYLDDRISVYNNLISSENKEDIDLYIHYFITPILEDEKTHPYLYRIKHFLSREYELYNHPDITDIVASLQEIFGINKEQIDALEDFLDFEHDSIENIYTLWQEFTEKVREYPLLLLNQFDYKIKDFVPVYSDPSTDEFVLKVFDKFVDDMKTYFPASLRRIDSFIFCDPAYIEYVAGEGTMAYFTSESVFLPCYVEEKDKNFFTETLVHEFGHFIFDLLPETEQILWYDLYDTWKENNIKMTRDEGKNDVEELFADVFSIIHSPVHDFIQQPSTIIVDSFIDIIEQGFQV